MLHKGLPAALAANRKTATRRSLRNPIRFFGSTYFVPPFSLQFLILPAWKPLLQNPEFGLSFALAKAANGAPMNATAMRQARNKLAIFVILYQVALPATYLRRCGRLVTPVQVFDLTHVYDATIPAHLRVT